MKFSNADMVSTHESRLKLLQMIANGQVSPKADVVSINPSSLLILVPGDYKASRSLSVDGKSWGKVAHCLAALLMAVCCSVLNYSGSIVYVNIRRFWLRN